jgi:acyl dehydratase
MTALVYLDDIEPGMRITNGPVTVSADEIRAFAAQFDPQPFHLDEDAAAASFFGRLAASGWHTAAIGMRLLVTGGPRLAGGYIGAGGELSWTQPVYAGDSLSLEAEVVEIRTSRSRPDRGIVSMRSELRNQRGEVVYRLLARMMVPRRPAPA